MPIQSSQEKQVDVIEQSEHQKYGCIQWYTNLLMYFLELDHNQRCQREIDALQKKINSQHAISDLSNELNQLIATINQMLPERESPFPPFYLLTRMFKDPAMQYYVQLVEKLLVTLCFTYRKISFRDEESVFSQLSQLWDQVCFGKISTQHALEKLQGYLNQINQLLSTHDQIPNINTHIHHLHGEH